MTDVQTDGVPSDLEQRPVTDLERMRDGIDNTIRAKRDQKRREALAKIEAVAQEHGFSLHELIAKSKNARPARYAHPEDPMLTWCGRGRRPKWMADLLAAGWSADDLRV